MKNFIVFLKALAILAVTGCMCSNASAQNNNALNFDGVNDYVSVANPITGTCPNGFTLEAMIKTNATANPSNVIITIGDGSLANQCVWLYLNAFGKLCAAMSGSNIAVSSKIINDNKWHHVAVVYDQHIFQLYVDGYEDGTPASVSPNITGTSTVIGSVSAANVSFWNGCIDAVRIWDIFLPSDTILYHSRNNIFGSRTNLLKNFNFNQGIAFGNNAGLTSTINESGNLLPGILYNFALTGTTSNWVSAGMQVSGNGNSVNDNSGLAAVAYLNGTNFGISEHGETITKTFTITNYGDTSITIPTGAFSITGYDPEDFNYGSITLPVTIYTGSSVTFDVTYTPDFSTQSASYAYVNIASNDMTTPDYNFSISGGFRANSLNFDGTDDYINTYNPLEGHNTNFCIEAWIKAPSTTVRRSIVSMGASHDNQGVYLFINTNGKLEADMAYHAGPISNITVADNKWHHVAIVNTANSFQLYIDGIADGSPVVMSPAFVGNTGLIGATFNYDCTATMYYFNGTMDEVRIWTVSRTPSEIFSNFLNKITVAVAGLESNYHFNQGVAGGSNQTEIYLLDESGYGHYGLLLNFSLLGTSSNWIAGSGLFVSGNGYLISSGNSAYSVQDNTNFGFSGPGTTITKTFKIKNSGAINRTISSGGITFSGTNPSDFSLSGITFPATIEADSVKTFNVVFTPNQIIPNASEAIVNINSNDFFSPNYSYSVTGGITASSLNFDGTNDFIRIPNPFSGNTSFTIETWVKVPLNETAIQEVITFGTDNTNNGYALFIESGYVKSKVYGVTSFNISSGTINDGNWHHIAAVKNGTTFRLYIDGNISGADAVIPATNFTGTNAHIGTSWLENYYYWKGNIDEVRFWTIARTQTEIQNNMWCEVSGPLSNLASSYHFSQGASNGYNSTVTSLDDASGNSRTGSLQNFTLTGTSSNWIHDEVMQEINVSGNGVDIADGDVTPSTADSTDFCFTILNNPVTKTFVINNPGASNLIIATGAITVSGSSYFTTGGITLPASIAPGHSLSFTVTYLPTTNGTSTAIINIVTQDCDETNYNFNVSGTGITGFTNITADQNPCDGNIHISWSWSGINPVSYELQRSTSVSFANPVVVSQTINGNSLSYNDIPPVGLWYYRIKYTDACGKSGSWYNGSGSLSAAFDTSEITMNPQTICFGEIYSFNSHNYNATGTYNDTLYTFFGCDSIIRTILTVNPTYFVNNPQEICYGNNYSFNGHIYTIQGLYYDTLHAVTGCDSIIVTNLTVHTLPIAFAGYDVSVCPGNYLNLIANGGTTYEWNNSTLNDTNIVLPTGPETYYVTVTNQYGCTSTDSVVVSIQEPFQNEQICLVTVDSLSNYNIIMWEKPLDYSIKSFLVYRDTANNAYGLVGEVLYDSLSLFIDTARTLYAANGDPNVTTWRYKIAVKDTCDNISDMSLYHQTIKMDNMGNGIFNWSHYEIEGQATPVPALSNYLFQRDDLSNGSYHTIATLSASSTSCTDPQYTTYQNTATWRVITAWSINCNPTKAGGHNSTRSNVQRNFVTKMPTLLTNDDIYLKIYPNPFSESTTITIHDFHPSTFNSGYTITDVTGKTVRTFNSITSNKIVIERGNLKAGIYFIELISNRVYRGKLVVE